jgi:DNA polymerase elongation subunit (family B)
MKEAPSPDVIKSFLEGSDPEEHIVSVEFDFVNDCIYKIKEIPGKGKTIQRDTFIPFAWVGDLRSLKFYNGSKELQQKAISEHKIVIEKLETHDNERLEKGLTFMVKCLNGYRSLIKFFRDGGLDPYGEKGKDKIMILPPVEQYLIQREKRLFKGFSEYNEITRFVFDLETTSLEPKDGRIFMIGMKTNKGYHRVIECHDDETEKNGIIEFFKVINELKPSIIGSYNGFNFDWFWIFERCKILGLDIKQICISLNPERKISQRENMLKLANEVEKYVQTSIWGYNVIDIIHAVRRAQAINSDIKSAGLKYITKYIGANKENRVYIDHTDIGPFYRDNENFWLNVQNGNWRKDKEEFKDLDVRFPGVYQKVTGMELVEKYLDGDLEETMVVDEEYNQASFLLASMLPTTYERVSTMGTATLWKMLMLAWSYKHKIAIPAKEEKTNFVGGLSRLIKVGYSENVLKLDFSSLYPSIQLVHDVFPECDVTNAMKGMLKFFRDARIQYKELAEEHYSTNPKLSSQYNRKQLPIKIFINSMFGALSAPQVFHWGDMYMGEQITCTGRQYLRQMIKFFMDKGFDPLVMDTDGVNFSSPPDVEDYEYIGKGLNWKVQKGKVYKGTEAHVAEYNDIYMRGEMALDTDGVWPSCINVARKNYALVTAKGKIKLVGNTIKSKKLPIYIEEFIDKGLTMLLAGDGEGFVAYYYEYIDRIYNRQIPLLKIANRAKVKLSIEDYIKRCGMKTTAGNPMSRMAHMELAIKENLKVDLGDVIYYVNNGTRQSHGDVQKKKDELTINCYRLDPQDIENNPDKVGEYNVPRAINTINKRIEPLLVVFDEIVRDNLLIDDPKDKYVFTKTQCKLINGNPIKETDQDSLDEVLTISDQELEYWRKRGLSPNYIYELADLELVSPT